MISTTAGNALNVCLLEVSCEYKRTVSLLDRLLHHSIVVVTEGESLRMREARQRGGPKAKAS